MLRGLHLSGQRMTLSHFDGQPAHAGTRADRIGGLETLEPSSASAGSIPASSTGDNLERQARGLDSDGDSGMRSRRNRLGPRYHPRPHGGTTDRVNPWHRGMWVEGPHLSNKNPPVRHHCLTEGTLATHSHACLSQGERDPRTLARTLVASKFLNLNEAAEVALCPAHGPRPS